MRFWESLQSFLQIIIILRNTESFQASEKAHRLLQKNFEDDPRYHENFDFSNHLRTQKCYGPVVLGQFVTWFQVELLKIALDGRFHHLEKVIYILERRLNSFAILLVGNPPNKSFIRLLVFSIFHHAVNLKCVQNRNPLPRSRKGVLIT